MKNKLRRKLEELESLKESVLRTMEGASSGALRSVPGPGRWSAAQIVDHVITAEGRSLEYIAKKTQVPEAVPAAGLMCAVRTRALVVALASPFRFKTPAPVSDVPDNPDPSEALARWSEVRERLRDSIESLPEDLLGRALFRHPVAGRMNMSQTLDFMTAHLRRHTKQLARTLS